jgi:hypothetical protein
MFFAEAQIRVHMYGKPADMRKSYDGLQADRRQLRLPVALPQLTRHRAVNDN